ncbi:CHAD domain-containing protein [Azotobacter chroococcum]|jgi:CHAD domain-containing protein|uniref:CHAD domain-containing protein n=1 Tax=Azotobacter chroococcum TaxID=353 RepID=A0A4R1PJ14_9GAMM|nr:CHAD domain-containing protein [Azotobacter chroococcum]TBV99223.1 CHAD domain-containing protein [Azotobacter chroococcum]TCL29561.1 CHAD domain-containing protein [Azotobacter chroococcum]
MIVDRLVEHVLQLDVALMASGARLQARSDEEALHDLRVAVRQLRSVLRPLRGLSDIDALEVVAAAVGHASTPLRDTEVLLQELQARSLAELSAPRRQALEAGRDALLASAEWLLLRNALEAWPAVCRRAERLGDLQGLRKHIRNRLAKQQRKLAEALRDPAHDRHRLRVLIKRVRYADEAYPELSALPAGTAKRLKAAQSALGDWHDRLQWLQRAEREADLQPLCEAWRQALADAAQRSDQALEPLCKDFPLE